MEKTAIFRNKTYQGLVYKDGKSGHATSRHIHQEWSLSYVIRGNTEVGIGRDKYRLDREQYIVIPPQVPHLCTPRDENNFLFGVLYLPCHLLKEINSNLLDKCFSGSCPEPVFKLLVKRILNAEDADRLKDSLIALHDFLGNSRKRSLAVSPPEISLKKQETIRPSDINKLSRFQQYYRSYNQYGVGYKNIEMIKRIETAKERLQSEKALAEVALDCGFYDQSHFTKSFKQYTGLTPFQYRRKSHHTFLQY